MIKLNNGFRFVPLMFFIYGPTCSLSGHCCCLSYSNIGNVQQVHCSRLFSTVDYKTNASFAVTTTESSIVEHNDKCPQLKHHLWLLRNKASPNWYFKAAALHCSAFVMLHTLCTSFYCRISGLLIFLVSKVAELCLNIFRIYALLPTDITSSPVSQQTLIGFKLTFSQHWMCNVDVHI